MRALVLCLSLFSFSAHADFRDGNKLLADLNDGGVIFPAVGLGYVIGVADALNGVTHCMPAGVTAGQLRDMVRNFLTNTPAIRHLPAADAVTYVLRQTWACPRSGRGT